MRYQVGRLPVTLFALVVTVVATSVILWPIVAYPVRADDQYWILIMPPRAEGSALLAYFQPFQSIFGDDGTQLRATAAAYGERRLAAVIVMAVAVWLAAPPAVIWAVMKVALLVGVVATLIFFLRTFRFWHKNTPTALSPHVVLTIAIFAPLIVLAAAEVGTYRLNNGWIFYPVLTYTPFIWYLGVSLLLIGLERFASDQKRWKWLVAMAASGFVGFFLNFAYEVVALAVPLSCVILLAYAGKDRPLSVAWWRAKLTILVPFGLSYTAMFLWIRWRLSSAQCRLDGTCYEGTLLEFSGSAIINNLLGALPWAAPIEFARIVANGGLDRGMLLSVAIAGLAAVSLFVFGMRIASKSVGSMHASTRQRSDIVGLSWIVGFMLAAVLGITVITAISQRAVERLQEPLSPYRAGPTIWMGLAIVLACVAVMIWMALSTNRLGRPAPSRWRGVFVLLVFAGTVVLVGSQHWQNVREYRDIASSTSSQALDRIHAEVARGDTSERGNERRCELLADYERAVSVSNQTVRQTLSGADASFILYHGQSFCEDD